MCLSSMYGDVASASNFLVLEACSEAVHWDYKQYPNSSVHHNYAGLGALMTAGHLVPDGEWRLQSYDFKQSTMHAVWQSSIYESGSIEDGQLMRLWDYHLKHSDGQASFHEWCLSPTEKDAASEGVALGIVQCSDDETRWLWRTIEGPSPMPIAPRVVVSGTVELAVDGSGIGRCMSANSGRLVLEDCTTAIEWEYLDHKWFFDGRGVLRTKGGAGLDCEEMCNGCPQYLESSDPDQDLEWRVSTYDSGIVPVETPMHIWTDEYYSGFRWCLTGTAESAVVLWNCSGVTSGVHPQWLWKGTSLLV